MIVAEQYQGIKKVALGVAYDENLLDSGTSEEEWLQNFFRELEVQGIPEAHLQLIDQWYLSLSDFEVSFIGGNPDELDGWDDLASYGPNRDIAATISKILTSYCE